MDLCLTLAESSAAILRDKIAHYSGQVPYLEVRLDYLTEPYLPQIPQQGGTQFIATCRPEREGGRYKEAEGARIELLRAAADSGFHWLDLEHDVPPISNLPSSTRIVRSWHCFGSFRQDLEDRFGRLKGAGGDVLKLAVSISTTQEAVKLLEWMESIQGSIPVVILGMGVFGQVSRLLGGFLGNQWTYVAEQERSRVAPGQFTLTQARDWYRLTGWNTPPPVFGVLGNPVQHSLSPLIHNRLFQHNRLANIYLPFPLDEVDSWFSFTGSSKLDFRGFSVTLPFKTDVLRLVKVSRSPVDSLNTMTKKGSSWEGSNTDYDAFLHPLKSRFSLKGKKTLVLGNGGVAHTVVKALQDEGCSVTVVGRNRERVTNFAGRYGCSQALFSDLPLAADLCVNATPVGQYPHVEKSPLQERELDFELVYDLVYRPERTRLLEFATRKGLHTVSGMEMFVEQAALQFLAWTGLSPDRRLIREILSEVLDPFTGTDKGSFRSPR